MADISLHQGFRTPLASRAAALGQLLASWRRRSRERHELAQLDRRAINDLGLTVGEVQFEASKPFWRA
jgi:uncharacterized protein YjiS (DUF1127 family)